jgi:hypothetical protein
MPRFNIRNIMGPSRPLPLFKKKDQHKSRERSKTTVGISEKFAVVRYK